MELIGVQTAQVFMAISTGLMFFLGALLPLLLLEVVNGSVVRRPALPEVPSVFGPVTYAAIRPLAVRAADMPSRAPPTFHQPANSVPGGNYSRL